MLVAQNSVRVELYARQPDNSWLLRDYTSLDNVVPLASLEADVPLTAAYEM
jgi:hypothetical protein